MLLSEKDILDLLRQRCQEVGTAKAVAEQLGVAPSYVSDVLAGRREIGKSIFEKLGYERVVMYRPLGGESTGRTIR